MEQDLSPGPWRANGECGDESVLDADGFMVADCAIFSMQPNWIKRRGDNSTNARLIARLPELLAYVERAAERGCPEAQRLIGSRLAA